MQVAVISLFPEWVEQVVRFGMPRVACERGQLALNVINPRDFADNRWRRVDRPSFGGGPGMVMEAAPMAAAIAEGRRRCPGPVLMLSPQGERFTQAWAERLSRESGFTLVCGRYEGVDERVLDAEVDMELSVGDVVLSGGELGAMMVVDACARLLPGVLGDAASAVEDSFTDGTLDHPHYTRPEQWRDQRVPEVLLSGDHAAIRRWRRQQALMQTWLKRPDLLEGLPLTSEDEAWLRALIAQQVVEMKGE